MSHDGGGGHSGGGHSGGGHGGGGFGGHHGHHGGSFGHHHSQDGWFSLGYEQRSGKPSALILRMVYFLFVFALAFAGVICAIVFAR
jgi:hypothetical protein